MEAVSGEEFMRWAADRGIGLDPRYPGSGWLGFLPPVDHHRFWVVPAAPTTWPNFLASLLDGLDEWGTGLLWPRSGSWPPFEESQWPAEGVRDVILRGAGIPSGWPGAVRWRREEENELVAVLFASLAFGWSVDDDLFFVPDHARQIVQTFRRPAWMDE